MGYQGMHLWERDIKAETLMLKCLINIVYTYGFMGELVSQNSSNYTLKYVLFIVCQLYLSNTV